MPGKAVGRAAVDLPWLCPNTDSLVGLAEQPAALAAYSAAGPALFAFLVRFAAGESASPFTPHNDRLLSSQLPEIAAALLGTTPDGWIDPTAQVVTAVRQVADLAAAYAVRIAEHTRRVPSELAATAARLAPLGWYAVAAVNSSEAAVCLRDPAFAADPAGCQVRRWGLDHDAVARRLAARWRFPRPLAVLAGSLNLPLAAAPTVGVDPDLFAVVALAVHAAEQHTTNLGLTHTHDRDAILAFLHLDADTAERLTAKPESEPAVPPSRFGLDPNPRRVPLVRHLLKMAAEARRRHGAALVARLEDRIDELSRAAADLAARAGDRLRDAKLAALAQLAAGAGHEINNPLTVISGNAQRLLRTEEDDGRADDLRAVVRQSQRISVILRDLMQFARPVKAERQRVSAADAMADVLTELTPLAEERGVRLDLAAPPARVWLDTDPKQLRQALAAVVRNGIEAAGAGGWVRLGGETSADRVRFVVEDSGPGLTAEAVEHAFDPFFCGRSAGRGRGLGLPIAWQLLRQNGGDVRFDPDSRGPTRFVVTLPRDSDDEEHLTRKSA